jgi:hypothetical protein
VTETRKDRIVESLLWLAIFLLVGYMAGARGCA